MISAFSGIDLVVFGAGELGGRVAESWVNRGGRCQAVTLTTQRHEALRMSGIETCLANVFNAPDAAQYWVFATPGSTRQLEAVQRCMKAVKPMRAVFCSSTVLFRSQSTERKEAARRAEAEFQQWAGEAGTILRFGGLYRTGRGPFAALQKGRIPAPGPGNRWLPLIHYDDAATAILNALQLPSPDPWYAVVTDPIPTRRAFYAAASQRLGVDIPFSEDIERPELALELDRTRRDLLPNARHPHWTGALG